MPLLIAIPIVIGLIIFGAIRLYTAVAADFGWFAGVGAIALVIALAVALVAALVHRHRRIHGVRANGQRTLSLSAPWGLVEVDADHQRGRVRLDGREASFIFADIAGAKAMAHGAAWSVQLQLRHNAQAQWHLPMTDGKTARRWEKILSLAAAQRL